MTRSFSHAPIDFRTMPPVVRWLLIANTAVFVLRAFVGKEFDLLFGLVPHQVLSERWVWQPFTYVFLHTGVFQLVFNLFCIWMFGMPVEAQWGGLEFVKFYVICGLGAAAAALAMGPGSSSPVTVGAAGPIFGLLVAFAMLYPDAVVYLYFLFPVTARQMAVIFGLIELFAAASDGTPGPGRFAGLGGMAAAYVYIRWWWMMKIKAKAWFKGMGVGVRPAGVPPRRGARPAAPPPAAKAASMEDVDRILDKILASGIDSLSEEEKSIMKRYAEKQKEKRVP
ncbi:MAG: rhomboid family intramembrane serine protease [Elusimicrobia bacterium]|nr:rhomboid family intramembrane serine protease [Elusimicrobiota bacterium]